MKYSNTKKYKEIYQFQLKYEVHQFQLKYEIHQFQLNLCIMIIIITMS